MKVLVTGGNGFIGQHVVQQLLNKNHAVAIFDRKLKSDNLTPQDRVEYVYGSITDPAAIHQAMSEVDGFIHLAGVLGTQETIKSPESAVKTNIVGGMNVLEAAAHYAVPGVNITVGNWWMNNTYSITKNMMERFVQMYNTERGTQISNIRIVNTYGPGQSVAAPFGTSSVRKIMPSFICRALTGRDIEIYGDGRQVSDIVYVEDVAKIIVLELESVMKTGAREHCLEIGSNSPLTVLEVAELVQKNVADLGFKKVNIAHLPMRPGENNTPLLSTDNELKLNDTISAMLPAEKNPERLSFATSAIVRSLSNKVIANLSTLSHLDVDINSFVSPSDGIKKTIEYYSSHKGKAWNDFK
ncbi:hypothetical protein BHU62_21415 [Serratia marcescens]|uniref:NAD-dependent epimerase/dehydratase domain-containing protein n=1 Tax=Serratia marcescens TaxID=615 RepID=A0A1Q4NV02_SERMA|nr:NAD-dependent epimerase/dehydratase family protein [Serratia marcescens]OKB64699.1 hypothetical protein BHU62_21415 [Serratia marcescens]